MRSRCSLRNSKGDLTNLQLEIVVAVVEKQVPLIPTKQLQKVSFDPEATEQF